MDSLRRVIEKLKAENERLRRGAGDRAKVADADGKLREAKARIAELREEVVALRDRAAAGGDASQRLAQQRDAVAHLRKQMRSRDKEIESLQKQITQQDQSKGLLSGELERANIRLQSANEDIARLRKGQSEQASASRMLSDNQATLIQKNREIEELKGVVASLRTKAQATGEGGQRWAAEKARLLDELAEARRGGGGGGALREEENARLREENAKLARELQAFDLDFFEEIEDLKFKYAEAQRKLQAFQNGR